MAIKLSTASIFAIVIPVLLGLLFSNVKVSDLLFANPVSSPGGLEPTATPTTVAPEKCKQRFQVLFRSEADPFANVSVVLHQNGDPKHCGDTGSGSKFHALLYQNYVQLKDGACPAELDKYQVESLLTKTFSQLISTCAESGREDKGFLGFCDAGKDKTPILLDHNHLVPVKSELMGFSLPCRFHTREGLRISYMDQLTGLASSKPIDCEMVDTDDGDDANTQTCQVVEPEGLPSEIHLYAVPAGRVFMFAPDHVGEIFHLNHVNGALNKPIYLKVMSLEPRVFDVFNFFSREESQQLVDKAIAETSETHRIKRSSTGASGYNINSRRTSESGFDTHGSTSTIVKKRCFSALGFDEYIDSHGDGLQILRYNVTTAYNSHLDWIADNDQLAHDYQSAGVGGNRFATILMYMSDMGQEDGGETVFPHGWPEDLAESERLDKKTALANLRESPNGSVLKEGSWEESLVATCRSRLAVRPHSSRAVLFYSQHPNGEVDNKSLHGACPVLSGVKYAANLWVWNTPRQGFSGAPIKEKFRKEHENTVSSPTVEFKRITAVFQNTGEHEQMKNAKLHYENQFWGDLGPNDPALSVNTYEGHVWNIFVDGKIVKTWNISEKRGLDQTFTF
ncbi:unnamed protein product [Cylindrotheca closterium]|uniref:Fe2OG dioxygenase domain-containing protein n=1 Tax=Cylindrotheca closterium TaxID=2856 RepID=A0AAD2FAY6_9STRA|nr:unnamed protein product [Cylindrotheca closterium]